MAISVSEFDNKPNLINCENGTYDLDSGVLRDHCAEDYLTMITKCSFPRNFQKIDFPRWDEFIDEITCGNKEVAAYLQRALGYSLFGVAKEECMFIAYGKTTRNGKGTLFNTIHELLGDYAGTISVNFICQGANKGDKRANREELTEEQQNKHNLKIELVKHNLTLLIDSAFRGNECKTSTTFDYSTELWQELKPYYKKNIGEARRKEIAELIADYFTSETVSGLKIKCFIHIEGYSNYIHFYIVRNGYTYGNDSNITDIYLRDIDPSHPFDPEGCRRNWSGEF